jgi:16S rRNA (cytosine967-C5)-methyltransferase
VSVSATRPGRATARAVAHAALLRVEDGAYANLVVPALLYGSQLDERDRRMVTELSYGTIRMRRACDWLVERHLRRPAGTLDPPVLAALRLGAYQLAFLGTPAHAAVDATVTLVPRSARGLVNAVLRKVATDVASGALRWPDRATRLSYPDWIVERLDADLGAEPAIAALETMNQPATVTRRADGYVQDLASQQVAAFVAGRPGRRTMDLCAAPGGKATAVAAATTGLVVAGDLRAGRARLIQRNARQLGTVNVAVVQADGGQPPVRPGSVDRVLVDAPCSGLGVLRRRPDARWRVGEADLADLVRLQRRLVVAAADLLAPGGTLVYSVCTLTRAEGEDIDAFVARDRPDLVAVEPPGTPWERVGRGARLLPQAAGTDGMYLLALARPARI